MEFLAGEWPSSMVPLSITGDGLPHGSVACTERQRDGIVGVDVTPPFTCHTHAPHKAEPVLDILEGETLFSLVRPWLANVVK